MKTPIVFGLFVAAVLLTGCGGPSDGESPMTAARKRANQKYREHAAKASPSVQEAFEASQKAVDGPESLRHAIGLREKMKVDSANPADLHLQSKINELLFQALLVHTRNAQERGTPFLEGSEIAKKLESAVDDPDMKGMVKKLGATTGDPAAKETVAAARETVGDAVETVDKKVEQMPADLRPKLPEKLQKHVDKALELKKKLEKAAKEELPKLIEEFVKNSKAGESEIAKALQDRTATADQALSAGLAMAGAAANVAKLAENWDNLSDVEKVAGCCAALAGVLEAVQPMVTASAAQYKAAVVIALKIISQFLPGLKIADLKFPGPDILGGDSDKGEPEGGSGPGGEAGKEPGETKPSDQPGEPAKKPGEDSKGGEPFKPSPDQSKEIGKRAGEAKEKIRQGLSLPDQASLDTTKIDMDRAKDIAAASVAGGDAKLKELVRAALQNEKFVSIGRLSERAASLSVQLAPKGPVATPGKE